VIRQSGDGGGLDLIAVQRDDELLDLIGLRRAVAGDDEVTRLLAALAAEVGDALPAQPTETSDLGSGPDTAPLPAADAAGLGRRLGAAGVAAAVLLGGSVALSGAAAAVTGDPLAPYKTVGHVVVGVGSAVGSVGSAVGDALSFGDDDLPEQAAPIAHLNKRLAGARAALAHGDTTEVRALVDQLSAVLATDGLSEEQRAALQQRLDKLEDSLARATAADGEGKKPTEKVPAEKAPADEAPADKAPADKAPADKAPADKAPADKAPADKAPADKAPADKAPADKAPETDGDTSGDTGDLTSDPTQQQAPAPEPRATTGSSGGGRTGGRTDVGDTGTDASQQSTDLGTEPTEQRGQAATRR
jgi:hypothetical protein